MLETLEDIKIEFEKVIDVAVGTFPPSNRLTKAIEELAEFAEISEDTGLYTKHYWDTDAQKLELIDCFVLAAILEKQFNITPEILAKYDHPFYINGQNPSTMIKNLAKLLYKILHGEEISCKDIKNVAVYIAFIKNQSLILENLDLNMLRKKYYQLLEALKNEGVSFETF